MNIFDYIEKKSKDIAIKIGKNDEKEDIEIYEYAIFSILSSVLTNGVGLILAFVFNIFLPYIVCVTSYMILRIFAGGYHCKTFKQCFYTSNILYLILTFLAIAPQNSIIILILAFIGGCMIIPQCPKPSEYSLSQGKVRDKKFRIKYVISLFVLIIIAIILLCFELQTFANTISYAILGTVFLVSDVGENILISIWKLIENE